MGASVTRRGMVRSMYIGLGMFPLRDSMQASLSGVWCTAIIAIFAAMTFKLYKLTDLAM